MCLGTKEIVLAPLLKVPCIQCNGTGFVKKCTCGSGIDIGLNETFCIICKPKPKERPELLINGLPCFKK